MPTIIIKINIEKELENSSFKHFLNDQDFDVYSSKEDDTNFTLIQKKQNIIGTKLN
jgi:hypothetical protein